MKTSDDNPLLLINYHEFYHLPPFLQFSHDCAEINTTSMLVCIKT